MSLKIDGIKQFILDMDGTVYLGETPIRGAKEFVDRVKQSGRRVMFFTNNTSKSKKIYFNRLKRMGFDVEESDVYSSGDVMAHFLTTERKGKTVYVVGTPDLEALLEEAGIKLAKIGEPADIVVSSFDTTLTYEKLVNACDLIRGGSEYLCTHPDINCPTETGFIPDSGAIAALINLSTGKTPKTLGKPYKETADFIIANCGCAKNEIAFVGDRLYTDIALGVNNDMMGILVLSGESTLEDVESAPEKQRPTYVIGSVAEID
ncbi:MAG: HAD-IIA family hydrolase [Ruminococcaceae bacterium]|nr:HAD-IIA family hydrolase [Oscillospiraceae bacterium]